MHFEVSMILMLPSHLVSLAPLGVETALVVDVGYSEAVVLPVCHGFLALHAWQALPLGAQAIHRFVQQLCQIYLNYKSLIFKQFEGFVGLR